jgi:cytidylate kinase
MSDLAGCMVAIDGPAGAGKSTIARAVAEETGFTYIDTGAMYRAVALAAMREDLDPEDDADAIGELAGRLRFEFRAVGDEHHLFVDGEDVERAIRTPEVGNLSSPVSAIPRVREHLVAAQRRMAEREPVVMEGRDIGTVVFPDALLKVFLTASAEERARRRYEQRREQGEDADYEQILADQRARDRRDTTREVAPLRRADDAVEIDSDPLTIEEVVERVMELLEDRLEDRDGPVV